MQKIIYQWKWGNNPTHDEYTTTRVLIIGNYNRSVEEVNKLAAVVAVDFPDVHQSDIDIGKISGTGHMDGFMCLSFLVPNDTKRSDYTIGGDRIPRW